MQKSILSIQPPADDESGKYLLIVTRGGGIMGGTSTVGFAVDRLVVQTDPKGRSYAIAAHRDPVDLGALTEKIIEFPLGTAYLLVPRNKVDFLTPLEAATRHKEEEDAINQVYKGQDGEAGAEPTELPGGAVLFPGETQVFPDRMYR